MPVEPTNTEQLVPLNLLPCRATGRNGRRVHVSTYIRWMTKPKKLRDGNRLLMKGLKTPGGWRTCVKWVEEYLDALTRDRLGIDADDTDAGATPAPTTPTPQPPRRRSARERAEASRLAGDVLIALGC